MVTCPKCGTVITSNTTLCPQCGTQIGEPLPGEAETYERRIVTILFADIANYSTLSEKIDPEELLEIMRHAYPCLIEPVEKYAGTVVQVMGDGVLAYFGTPAAREDDPERAVRAGMEITARIKDFASQLQQERGLADFNVRVGINTGLVVIGELHSDRHLENIAMGDAVNLAARLQQNASPGSVLISQATYRHVRGSFELLPQEPLRTKGREHLEQTYLVLPHKVLENRPRGIDGIRTSMIGRDPEMMALQNSFQDAMLAGETRLVLITGEAGLGKTRLMDEFSDWVDGQPTTIMVMKGRMGGDLQNVPYAVFRNLFAHHFKILESDSSAQAWLKFREGTRDLLSSDQAELVGQLVGFDFREGSSAQRMKGNPDFAQMAGLYLVNTFRSLASKPLLLLLEDLHWMDDSSLDLIIELVTSLGREKGHHSLIVCSARPQFFERRPNWGEGLEESTRLDLHLLSRARSRALIAEILQKAATIPEELYECVVEESEGNPFFIEELIKMFIDEGVIETDCLPWRVNPEKLAVAHVPPTLTGILQARLDGLPAAEKQVLQKAAVIGRVFWDGSIAAMSAEKEASRFIPEQLAALRERGLVFLREHSTIAGHQEYLFKHALLRDAAYQTVLLKHRRRYHGQVADWIESHAGARLEEHLALVADHYAEAGRSELASDWFIRAGERALRQCSMAAARHLFEKALDLIRPEDQDSRWRALLGHEQALVTLGASAECRADEAILLDLARQSQDDTRLAAAWFRVGCQANTEGKNQEALYAFEQVLEAARRIGDLITQAKLLPMLVNSYVLEGDLKSAAALVEQALEIATQTGDPDILAHCLNNLSVYFLAVGDVVRSVQFMQRQVEINQGLGNRLGEMVGLLNLGYYQLSLGHFQSGYDLLERSLVSARSLGVLRCEAYALLNLGFADWRLGRLEEAYKSLEQCLPKLEALDDRRGLAARWFYLGLVREAAEDIPAASEAYEAARTSFQQLGALAQAVEAVAGLARLALRRKNPSKARENGQVVFDWLAEHGPGGLELATLAYLTCARVFQVLGDVARLEQVLKDGRVDLQNRLALISDAGWRETFLHALPENQELMTGKIGKIEERSRS